LVSTLSSFKSSLVSLPNHSTSFQTNVREFSLLNPNRNTANNNNQSRTASSSSSLFKLIPYSHSYLIKQFNSRYQSNQPNTNDPQALIADLLKNPFTILFIIWLIAVISAYLSYKRSNNDRTFLFWREFAEKVRLSTVTQPSGEKENFFVKAMQEYLLENDKPAQLLKQSQEVMAIEMYSFILGGVIGAIAGYRYKLPYANQVRLFKLFQSFFGAYIGANIFSYWVPYFFLRSVNQSEMDKAHLMFIDFLKQKAIQEGKPVSTVAFLIYPSAIPDTPYPTPQSSSLSPPISSKIE